jgi:sulfate transport system substrate-binding protein
VNKKVIATGVIAVVCGVALSVWLLGKNQEGGKREIELLNVSYDPTRELWRDLNRQFSAAHEKDTGNHLVIRQSHGGSTTQARAVIDGLEADVVTLALWPDTDAIRQRGLIRDGWEDRLPNHSLPYFSTIVFVVRKGNPKQIKDWPDLVRTGVQVITPNPKTSGNGKLSFLAAWGAAIERGRTEAEARAYVTQLYEHVPVLDTGARGATATFAQKQIGDVHLTWENEARLELKESKDQLEIIYPPVSIRAEPQVAVVDANVDQKGTREVAEAYLRFLYTPPAQETIASHFYRPIDENVLRRHAQDLPPIKLFSISRIAVDWNDAQKKFLAEGGEYDRIAGRQPKK